ncbi:MULTISPECIES: hypothetical protein [Aliarcobacter]|uniref:hypothetical protein n=1 Tax=Aliarcobacter TaxID=2321111 RepID=UPI0021B2236D|nr:MULTISPECIES: hypothetical protein [Aliarcobacter]MCT7404624.1 hypothetical protein [Aliarcobacter cryaerophilus]MCT7484297.1 hypothetical protein [Aliarcobacter cryaerophilus]MCT7502370.1 hypothetical protein [Aliarcobacter cryaerophilus]MCT7532178.1 hypothetical protein [Aliarcobacter cryaerophilus]MCT7632072.1 hypothetical protein [Aliarcobacter butzleri]
MDKLELITSYGLRGLVLYFIVTSILILIGIFLRKLQKNKEETNTCGIVAFVLSIVAFFFNVFGIFFALIAFICGVKNYKNAFGIIGIIFSGIYLLIMLPIIFGFASFLIDVYN